MSRCAVLTFFTAFSFFVGSWVSNAEASGHKLQSDYESGHAVDHTVDYCAAHIRMEEQRYDIPSFLLYAIALGESGRYYREERRSVPWPWTVRSGPESKYFPNQRAAIAYIRKLQAQGRTNIDVGCMQVNLHAHGDAFRSLEEAIDPQSNVAYAASFLNSLYQRHTVWSRAVGYYHSATPHLNARYRKKVAMLWHDVARKLSNDRALRERLSHAAQPQKIPDRARQVGDLSQASPFFQAQVFGTARHTPDRHTPDRRQQGGTHSESSPLKTPSLRRPGATPSRLASSNLETPEAESSESSGALRPKLGLRDYRHLSGGAYRRAARSVAIDTVTVY